MGGLIPLTDASRRSTQFPIVTAGIMAVNFLSFALELRGPLAGTPFRSRSAHPPVKKESGDDNALGCPTRFDNRTLQLREVFGRGTFN